MQYFLFCNRWGPHHTDEAFQLAKENCMDLMIIPGGMTGKLQPGDLGWNKPFKDAIRKSWKNWMRRQKANAKGKISAPTRSQVLRWVSEAWKSVSEDTIRKAFKIAGISNALDGSEDDLFLGESSSKDPDASAPAGEMSDDDMGVWDD